MEQINTIYFIDSENINDVWVSLFDNISENDRVIVFYTDKSAHISCENVRKLMEIDRDLITWISCYNLSSNALDFQLVTELGAMAAKNSAKEYVIVSNDTGFDSVVKYWSKQSVNIRRIKGNMCNVKIEKPAEPPETKTHSEINNFIGAQTAPTASSEPEAEKIIPVRVKAVQVSSQAPLSLDSLSSAVISRLSKSMLIRTGTLLNNSLNNLFSTPEQGNKIYGKLKSHPEYGQSLRKNLLKSKTAKIENYISLILDIGEIECRNNAEISRIIIKYLPDGSKKVHEKLVKEVGQEQANQIYKVLKKHFAVLKKL